MTDKLKILAENISAFTSDNQGDDGEDSDDQGGEVVAESTEDMAMINKGREIADVGAKKLMKKVDGIPGLDKNDASMCEMETHGRAISRGREIEDKMDRLDAKMDLVKSYKVAKKLPNLSEIINKLKATKEDMDALMWDGYTDSLRELVDAANVKLADFIIVQAAITRKSQGKKK